MAAVTVVDRVTLLSRITPCIGFDTQCCHMFLHTDMQFFSPTLYTRIFTSKVSSRTDNFSESHLERLSNTISVTFEGEDFPRTDWPRIGLSANRPVVPSFYQRQSYGLSSTDRDKNTMP